MVRGWRKLLMMLSIGLTVYGISEAFCPLWRFPHLSSATLRQVWAQTYRLAHYEPVNVTFSQCELLELKDDDTEAQEVSVVALRPRLCSTAMLLLRADSDLVLASPRSRSTSQQ